ncbi:MAG: RNA-binding S4 domain-containing protein [Heyndrickxia sp.]
MQEKQLYWNIVSDVADKMIYKHCKNCEKTVLFKDTLIRRHNANGKNIYRFAIYKCEKDHTWNQKLSIYKTFTDHVKNDEVKEENYLAIVEDKNIEWSKFVEDGIGSVSIVIQNIIGDNPRMDKILSERISDLSRSQIVRKIKDKFILINQETCRPSQKLIKNDVITLHFI